MDGGLVLYVFFFFFVHLYDKIIGNGSWLG